MQSHANEITRQTILHLYKRCLKSANRIPSIEQRLMYQEYVQEGFRRKRDLWANTPQALAAISDAQEQLERMNYYHSIREMKREEERKKNQSHFIEQQETAWGENQTKEEETSETENQMYNEEQKIEKSSHTTFCAPSEKEKFNIVSKWLTSTLPHLHNDDHIVYTKFFIQDGFDSIAMLEEELMEEDLSFMKKAHRRALLKNKNKGTH
uniref:Complex 1 LYR protein domain-containing protein n=1 Tax=Ditylum brightwellii TaxID=49249 RepID=A0A7S4S2N0_9STRA